MDKQFSTGLVPSPIDKCDILSSEITPTIKRIPTEFPPPFDLEVLDQNHYPACVGFSCAALKQEKEMRERVVKTFDGKWIYDEAKKIDGIPNFQGTYLRAGMKILLNKGAKPIEQPATEAPKYRIGGYARVDDLSFEGLKKAIAVHGALIVGMRGTNAGWQNAHIRPPKTGEKLWGHAIALIAYTKDYLIFQNSWGNWGENGLGYIPANYLPFEAWVSLVDRPDTISKIPEIGLTGWIAQKYVRPILCKGNKIYPYVRLNIREEPFGKKIATLNRGDVLTIISDEIKINKYKWIKVQKNG